MEALGILGMIGLVLVLGLGIRLAAGSMDRDRITTYLEERGGRVVSITWAPFGKGWFGDKNDRIYEVVYYDSRGDQHFATCKTSLFSGVYWTEDRVTHPRSAWFEHWPRKNEAGKPLICEIPHPPAEDLATENQRLREENARLREELERRDRERP